VALTKREQTISWVVGAAVGLLVVYYAVNAFYLAPLAEKEKQIAAAQKKANEDKVILDRQKIIQEEWKGLQAKGLTDNASTAALQFTNEIFTVARANAFNLRQLNASGAMRSLGRNSDFEEMRFQAAGESNTMRLGSFLYALETAGIPVRIDDLTISAKKEGTDQLGTEMTISALVFAPKKTATKPAASTRTAARGATQPATRAATQPAARAGTPAPATPSSESVEDLAARMRAKRAAEERSAVGATSQPSNHTGGVQ
jgi:hypothetical protein